jgi:ribosomal protein S18 acetylase RimI-like enzyme
VTLAIRPATPHDLPAFFAYLDDHLSDNGDGGVLFQPLPRGARSTEALRAGFTKGLATSLGQAGWRRLWLAFDDRGAIAGHIDLRARPEPAAAHRALLGMGVDRGCRRHGLGQRLLGTAIAWAGGEAGLEWIDLEVLSANLPARGLYERAGFSVTGSFDDFYRIDGASVACTLMSRRCR